MKPHDFTVQHTHQFTLLKRLLDALAYHFQVWMPQQSHRCRGQHMSAFNWGNGKFGQRRLDDHTLPPMVRRIVSWDGNRIVWGGYRGYYAVSVFNASIPVRFLSPKDTKIRNFTTSTHNFRINIALLHGSIGPTVAREYPS